MAVEHCVAQLKACRMRVCLLDANGVPRPGSQTMYVTRAMSKVTIKHVYTDGDEVKEKNACGEQMLNVRGPDNFDRVDVEIELLQHDPYLLSMLIAGSDLITVGDRLGYSAPELGTVPQDHIVSIEVWAQRANASGTGQAVAYPYAWWVLPWVMNTRLGDRTFENAASKPIITGQGYENDNWYNGPLNDWPTLSDRAYQWVEASSLPTDACGPLAIAAS